MARIVMFFALLSVCSLASAQNRFANQYTDALIIKNLRDSGSAMICETAASVKLVDEAINLDLANLKSTLNTVITPGQPTIAINPFNQHATICLIVTSK